MLFHQHPFGRFQCRTSLQQFSALLLGDEHRGAITVVGYGITVAWLLRCIPRVRDVASFGRQSVSLLLVFLVFGMPLFSPWYHLWWLPLIAIWAWPGWVRVFSAVAVFGPLSHLVYAATHSFGLAHEVWTWAIGLMAVVTAAALPARED